MTLTSEQMRVFQLNALARESARVREIESRRSQAWPVARQAARLLKEKFGVSQVLVFGSLAHGHWFHPSSDIDLAIWGITDSEFWRAWAEVDGLAEAFSINLVIAETLPTSVRDEIIGYGVTV